MKFRVKYLKVTDLNKNKRQIWSCGGRSGPEIYCRWIAKNSQGSDYAFRVGGEEFVLLLVDTDQRRAMNIAENIRKFIEAGIITTVQGMQFKFTVSIGCVIYDGHPDYQEFLDTADTALYAAKKYQS